MLGDTAVAVNPNDERYKHLVGKTVVVPFVNREIPVIADEYVDMEFGTGVVKITPAHDPNDFEVGVRHNLPVIRVMNDDGTMNENAGEFAGLDRYEARKRIVAETRRNGYFAKTEPHKHNVGSCYRCHATVEPIVSKQWFVKNGTSCKTGDQKQLKRRNTFSSRNGLKNVLQLDGKYKKTGAFRVSCGWGHRIPVWYCGDCAYSPPSKSLGSCAGVILTTPVPNSTIYVFVGYNGYFAVNERHHHGFAH